MREYQLITPIPVRLVQEPGAPPRVLSLEEGLARTVRDALERWAPGMRDRQVRLRIRLRPEEAHLIPRTRAARRRLSALDAILPDVGAAPGSEIILEA